MRSIVTMSEYRRAYIPGSSVFITLVTYQRKKLLLAAENSDNLRQACEVTISEKPFEIEIEFHKLIGFRSIGCVT
jgi:putative transposase